ALTAATSVVWSLELTAFWMMFLDGYIGAPPTVTVCSFIICANEGAAATPSVRAAAATVASAIRVYFIAISSVVRVGPISGGTGRAGLRERGDAARVARSDQPKRSGLRACAGRNEPELHGFLVGGQHRGRHDHQGAAGADRGHEAWLPARLTKRREQWRAFG